MNIEFLMFGGDGVLLVEFLDKGVVELVFESVLGNLVDVLVFVDEFVFGIFSELVNYLRYCFLEMIG